MSLYGYRRSDTVHTHPTRTRVVAWSRLQPWGHGPLVGVLVTHTIHCPVPADIYIRYRVSLPLAALEGQTGFIPIVASWDMEDMEWTGTRICENVTLQTPET